MNLHDVIASHDAPPPECPVCHKGRETKSFIVFGPHQDMWCCNNHKFHGAPIGYEYCTENDFFGPYGIPFEKAEELAELVLALYGRIDVEIMRPHHLVRGDRFGQILTDRGKKDIGCYSVSVEITKDGRVEVSIYFFSDIDKQLPRFESYLTYLLESLRADPLADEYKVRFRAYIDRKHTSSSCFKPKEVL